MAFTKAHLLDWLQRSATVLDEHKAHLTELDSAIGDADHGANIARGFSEAASKASDIADKDIGAILKATSLTLMSKAGGASGMLYGNFFLKASAGAAGKEELSDTELADLLQVGVDGIVQRGRAEAGDKTMLDAWFPALESLHTSLGGGKELADALSAAAVAAGVGKEFTVDLVAKKGRASYLGERSIGHQDPGATSTHLILQALADSVAA